VGGSIEAPVVALLRLDDGGGSRAERSELIRRLAVDYMRSATGLEAKILGGGEERPRVGWRDPAGEASPPAISLSYCDGWAGFALAPPAELGFDLEPSGRVGDDVARRAMAVEDLRAFEALDPSDRTAAATRHWTAAEALAKATGRGLPLLLGRGLEIGLGPGGEWEGYRFAVVDASPGITCALACDGPADLRAALAEPVLL
jgi:hypothetical protein